MPREVGSVSVDQGSRIANARITFRSTHLRFDRFPVNDSIFDDVLFYDVDSYGTGFLRVVIVGSGRDIYFQYVDDPNTFTIPMTDHWGSWVDSGINAGEFSHIALYGGRMFYVGVDGDAYYSDFNGTSFGSPVSFYTTPGFHTAFAPVSSTVVYMLETANIADDYSKIIRFTIGSGSETWSGRVFGDYRFLAFFDAVRRNGKDYVFFTDEDRKRTLYLIVEGSVWGDVRQFIPLDVVDDTSAFTIGAASIIDNKIFVAGVIKRDSHNPMHIFSYEANDGHFSLGREMFIRPGQTQEKIVLFNSAAYSFTVPAGKLILVDDVVWYVAPGIAYFAYATNLVGVDPETFKLVTQDFSRIEMTTKSNSPYGLEIEPKYAIETSLIKPGNEIVVEAGYNGNYAQIGEFDIDMASNSFGQTGKQRSILASSKAMKRISQWEPDASYDYWSQTKLFTNPAELTKVIRATGRWSGEDTLTLDNLNVKGFLYAVDRPTRNHVVQARFKFPSGTYYTPIFGVVLQFYHSASDDANGLVAYYEDGSVYLKIMRGGELGAVLDSHTFGSAPSDDTWYWMQASFHDGDIRVYWGSDLLSLSEIIQISYENADLPWYRDDYVGRGALYLENVTPHSDGYPFTSSDVIVPVDDNSDFPDSDIVIVDDELIEYSGKSNNSKQTGITYLAGDLTIGNTDTTGAIFQRFADSRTRNAVIQTFALEDNFYVNGISVYVKRDADQTDGLVCAIYQGPRNASKPIGTKIASCTIPASDISDSTPAWVTGSLYSPVMMNKANSYWLVLHREKNPTHPTSEGFDIGYTITPYIGVMYTFNENTDSWSAVGGDALFKILGSKSANSWQVIVGNFTPPDDPAEYNDMGLTVTSGQGMNDLFQVLGYGGATSLGHILFVDRDPSGVVGSDSVFSLVPTLIVKNRGYNNTFATYHGHTIVSLYRNLSSEIDKFGYFSADMDMRLSDIIRELASKAGVEFIDDKEIPTSIVYTGDIDSNVVRGENLIVKMELSSFETGIVFRMDEDLENGYAVTEDSGDLRLYSIAAGSWTEIQNFPAPGNHAGLMATFSVFERYVSVWIADRYIHTFVLDDDGPGIVAATYCAGNDTLAIDWSQLDMRQDNFIFDMGSSGSSMIAELSRDRRIFFQDDQYGRLRAFAKRVSFSTSDVYRLAVLGGINELDADFASRVRLVGFDIYEGYDVGELRDYGNVFRLKYSQILETESEHRDEVLKTLQDIASIRDRFSVIGAFDPRIEPNDVVMVNTGVGDAGSVVVNGMDISISLDESEVIMDMRIDAFRAPESRMVSDVIISRQSKSLDWSDGSEIPGTAYENSVILYSPIGSYFQRFDYDRDGLVAAFAAAGDHSVIFVPSGEIENTTSDTVLELPIGSALVGDGKESTNIKGFEILVDGDGSRIENICVKDPVSTNPYPSCVRFTGGGGDVLNIRHSKLSFEAEDQHSTGVLTQAQSAFLNLYDCDIEVSASGTAVENLPGGGTQNVPARGCSVASIETTSAENRRPTIIRMFGGKAFSSHEAIRASGSIGVSGYHFETDYANLLNTIIRES